MSMATGQKMRDIAPKIGSRPEIKKEEKAVPSMIPMSWLPVWISSRRRAIRCQA